jgi:hypothetical protein
MNRSYIRSHFSNRNQWVELLEPNLRDIHLEFIDFVLIVAIQPYKAYIGFIQVKHTSEDSGIWFSEFVKIRVEFTEDITIEFIPVHFRKEILYWSLGTILLDKRDTLLQEKARHWNLCEGI